MARTASDEFLRRKAEPQCRPLEIWDIHLGSQTKVDSNTLFFAVTNANIKFFSYIDGTPQTFIALGISRSPIARHIDSKIDSLEISLDNVDRAFSQHFLDFDLRGKRIVVRKVFADILSAPQDSAGKDNFIVMFDGIMDNPTLSQTRYQATAKNNIFQSLAFMVPRRTFQGLCNWKFGNTGDCANHQTQTVLFHDTSVSGDQTVDSMPNQLQIKDAARTEGGSGDYWAPGIITMLGGTAGNIGISRRIVQSTHTGDLFIEATFPFEVKAGDTYKAQRDCGHTLNKDCRDRFQNNSEYGGFVSIPENLVRRD